VTAHTCASTANLPLPRHHVNPARSAATAPPDGSTVAYVSFRAGTLGHPADIDDVRLRLLDADGRISEVATIFGGQGTMNVPSWSPDSTRFAYVAYPIS
jgi:TolB protein